MSFHTFSGMGLRPIRGTWCRCQLQLAAHAVELSLPFHSWPGCRADEAELTGLSYASAHFKSVFLQVLEHPEMDTWSGKVQSPAPPYLWIQCTDAQVQLPTAQWDDCPC